MNLIPYDEFSLFHENISEYELNVATQPVVARVKTQLPDGRVVSAMKWGSAEPSLVFVHGSGQNAHTWDTVALALGFPYLQLTCQDMVTLHGVTMRHIAHKEWPTI